MPAVVEGQCGVLDVLVGGGGAGGEEARADPLDEVVGGDVVARDDEDAPASARADPVLGQRYALGRAGAGGVDLRVRPAGTDDLGELGVAHRQHLEQEAPVEGVGLGLHVLADRPDALVDLPQDRVAVAGPGPQRLQRVEQLPAGAVGPVALELVRQSVGPWEGRGEHDAGVVAQRVRQHPPVRAAACRCSSSCTSGPAGCRRRAVRRSRRRRRGGSPRRGRRPARRRSRTRGRGRARPSGPRA